MFVTGQHTTDYISQNSLTPGVMCEWVLANDLQVETPGVTMQMNWIWSKARLWLFLLVSYGFSWNPFWLLKLCWLSWTAQEARSPVWVKWDSRRSLDPSEFQLALLSSELCKQHRGALLFKLPVFQEFVYTYLCLTKIGAPTPRMLDELRRHNGIQSGALKSFSWAVTLSWDGSGRGLMRSWTESIPGGRKSVEQCWEAE